MNHDTVQTILNWLLAGGGLIALLKFFRDRKKDGYLSESVRVGNDEKRVKSAQDAADKADERANKANADRDEMRAQYNKDRDEWQDSEDKLRRRIVDLEAQVRGLGGTP